MDPSWTMRERNNQYSTACARRPRRSAAASAAASISQLARSDVTHSDGVDVFTENGLTNGQNVGDGGTKRSEKMLDDRGRVRREKTVDAGGRVESEKTMDSGGRMERQKTVDGGGRAECSEAADDSEGGGKAKVELMGLNCSGESTDPVTHGDILSVIIEEGLNSPGRDIRKTRSDSVAQTCEICTDPLARRGNVTESALRAAAVVLPSVTATSSVCKRCVTLLTRIDTARLRLERLEANLRKLQQRATPPTEAVTADVPQVEDQYEVDDDEDDGEEIGAPPGEELELTCDPGAASQDDDCDLGAAPQDEGEEISGDPEDSDIDADILSDDEEGDPDFPDPDEEVPRQRKRVAKREQKPASVKSSDGTRKPLVRRPSSEFQFQCPTCDKKLATAHSLRNHEAIHTGERPFACDGCDRRFASEDGLRQHAGVHIGKFVCELCGKRYSNEPALSTHRSYAHFPERLKVYDCQLCGKQFKGRLRYRRHMNRHNSTGKEYPCSVPGCGKVFQSPSGLRVHMGRHTGQRFTCDHCPMLFATKTGLRQHMIIHSNAEAAHVCPHCALGFLYRKQLDRHMNNVHLASRDCVCEHCGAAFGSESALASHQVIHSEERPYVCDQCAASYKRKKQLTKHVILTHTPELSSRCPECGKRFQTAHNMQVHMRSHTGQRPYGCPCCTKRFMQHAYMRRHLKTHSDVERAAAGVVPNGLSGSANPTASDITDLLPRQDQNAGVSVGMAGGVDLAPGGPAPALADAVLAPGGVILTMGRVGLIPVIPGLV